MIVKSDRFGSIETPDDDVITFPSGVVGFPNEQAFVLLRPRDEARIAWLQSTRTPSMALPIVSLHETAIDAPFEAFANATHELGLAEDIDDCAVLLVVTANGGARATVNLLAPIIVNAATRTGVQVLIDLDSRMLTTPLCLRPLDEPSISEMEASDESDDGPMALTSSPTHQQYTSAAE
jgi:flagellar assembly factor FliW